jgi:hypothetical protein
VTLPEAELSFYFAAAAQVAAVELDQFGSLSLIVVGRTADSQTCSYLQAASASDLP